MITQGRLAGKSARGLYLRGRKGDFMEMRVRESAVRLWSRWSRPMRWSLRDNEPVLIALCAPLGALVGFAVVTMHEGVATTAKPTRAPSGAHKAIRTGSLTRRD